MDKKFDFNGTITFANVLEMYERIISVGLKPANIYGLFAENFEHGINFGADFHFKEMDYWISISEKNEEKDLEKKLGNGLERFHKDNIDSRSNDLIVANSPKVRHNKELSKWRFEEIANKEIDRMNMYKQSKIIPTMNNVFQFKLPFVTEKDIFISKKNGIYSIQLTSDTKNELDIVYDLFNETISSNI